MYPRHDLAWLTPLGWAAICERASRQHRPMLDHWQRQDWPVVVRRSEAGTSDNIVCFGVALPPDGVGEKLRIAIRAPKWDVQRMRSPLTLAEVLPHIPEQWRHAFTAFTKEAGQRQLDIRVYGSLALQALTGRSYLRQHSDIDVLFNPRHIDQVDEGLACLGRYATMLPLDGEIIFDDLAVSWKEWSRAARLPDQRVLVKYSTGVSLRPCRDLLSTFSVDVCKP